MKEAKLFSREYVFSFISTLYFLSKTVLNNIQTLPAFLPKGIIFFSLLSNAGLAEVYINTGVDMEGLAATHSLAR